MEHRSWSVSFVLGVLASLGLSSSRAAQTGTVQSAQKISETAGGFGGGLDVGDEFGSSVAALGDLDGDGNRDLAVGARDDDDGGGNQGAVWILFLNSDGTVASEQKISETSGGFGGVLDLSDSFGSSVASLGDLDGDGNEDLAVGAVGVSGTQGAVWILFLNSDGTVASEQKIAEAGGGFGGALDPGDLFGCSVASLGDLDGDGNPELAVGALNDDDGGNNQGAVWILFLNSDGTVASEQKISETTGGFGSGLDPLDHFGWSAAAAGDLDGDGTNELAVGAPFDDDGGGFGDQGALWILFLNADGTVASKQKISATAGGFGGGLVGSDLFGVSLASLGDLDADGNPDLVAGVFGEIEGLYDQGAVWVLFLNADGTVASKQKISVTEGGFGGVLDEFDYFGWSVCALGDLDGDGDTDLAAGAIDDDDGGTDQGAVWILFLEGDVPPPSPRHQRGRPTVTLPPVFVPSTAGSGGPRTLPRPSEVSLRNGSGVNESCLSSASAPLAGEEWQIQVDLSAHPGASALLVMVSDRAQTGTPSPFGELLIDASRWKPLFTSFVAADGATHVHELSFPAHGLGQSLSLQALILDGRESVLTNALDVVVGRAP